MQHKTVKAINSNQGQQTKDTCIAVKTRDLIDQNNQVTGYKEDISDEKKKRKKKIRNLMTLSSMQLDICTKL
jgi:hypothetical protein